MKKKTIFFIITIFAIGICGCTKPKAASVWEETKAAESTSNEEAPTPTIVPIDESAPTPTLAPTPEEKPAGVAQVINLEQSSEGIDIMNAMLKSMETESITYRADVFEKQIQALYGHDGLADPKINVYCDFNETYYGANKTYVLSKGGNYDRVMLYIHGGSYIYNVTSSQVSYIDGLAYDTNSLCYIPIYPLAPNHTYQETYDFLDQIYNDLLATGKSITIIGDSAGGGLALGFVEHLNEVGVQGPDKLALISPLVDVTGTNEDMYSYENYDPVVTRYEVVRSGMVWAGETEVTDYHISPLYGNLTNMPNVFITTGTYEILFPDTMKLYSALKDNGENVTLVCGQGLFHVFPFYPIPEADTVRNMLIDFINS